MSFQYAASLDGPASLQQVKSYIDEGPGAQCVDYEFSVEAAPATQFDLRHAGLSSPIAPPFSVVR